MSDPRKDDLTGLSPTAAGGRGKGVRRVNSKPLIAVLAIAIVVLLVFAYSAVQRANRFQGGPQEKQAPVSGANAAKITNGLPAVGEISAAKPPPPPEPDMVPPSASLANVPAIGRPDYSQAWQSYLQASVQAAQQRRQAAAAALQASPSVSLGSSSAGGGGDSYGKPAPLVPGAFNLPGQASTDPNYAKDKAAWAKSSENDHTGYLESPRMPPLSPFEIKTGTVIPGIMIGGVSSDLPGEIIGQVRENVYDTATGAHLLIPQGARLVGTYDNQIARGQTRVLVAWTRIVFPDGSALDLSHFPGSDQAGYAGFKDKVNTHIVRVFGDALLMSLFSAGIQLSQPQASNGQNYSSSQIVAASVGQQMGEAGMQIVQRDLSIQPTITIRPGYRFQVMVTRDIILPPWSGTKG